MSEKHSKIVFLDSLACSDTPCWLPELFVICNDSSLDAQYERPCADVDNAQFVKLMQICNEDRILSL